MPRTVLITGFGPFPGMPVNPTGPLVERLARLRRPAFAQVARIAHVFPTSYAAVDRELPALIDRHRPELLLMFGVAGRTRHIRIETRARNRMSAVHPDATRARHARGAIDPAAPLSRPLRAPAARLLAAARASGAPAALSRDAGSYLCNYLCWRALDHVARSEGPRLAAFVHVPKDALNDGALLAAGDAILRAALAAR